MGDGEHRFWVEATSTGEWVNDFARELTLSVYREKEDGEPVQVIETETGMWPNGFQLYGEDVDFDGYTDFYYTYSQGTHDSYYSFYIWDPAAERLIPDPYDLNSLPSPGFHGESKTVAAGHRSAASGTTTYYRYQDGALDPVRECSFDAWGGICRMAVQDKQYDSMQTVFQVERDGAFTDEDWEEFFRWYDLDYHGDGHSLYLDVGDGEHRFWVEIAQLGEGVVGQGIPVMVSVYFWDDRTQPIQTWEDDCLVYDFEYVRLAAQDVDFDGCMDMSYSSWIGASSGGDAYWVWDREAERFIRDPYGLEELLSFTIIDPEQQVVETWIPGGPHRRSEYYRYMDGELTCVRTLDRYDDMETGLETMKVEDYVDGKLVEVLSKERSLVGMKEGEVDSEFSQWFDLDYHG